MRELTIYDVARLLQAVHELEIEELRERFDRERREWVESGGICSVCDRPVTDPNRCVYLKHHDRGCHFECRAEFTPRKP